MNSPRDAGTGAPDDEDLLRELSDEVMPILRDIVRRFRAGSHDVTPAQLAVLREVEQHEGTTAAEIATVTHITPAATSQTISRLTELGYLTGHRCNEDRRVVRLALTDAGRGVVHAAGERGMEIVADLFQPLSPSERRQLIDMLRRVRRR